MIQADELVVPDTLFEVEETIGQALAFGRLVRDVHETTGKSIRYMAVLQGRNWSEFVKCLRTYAEMPALTYISTVGVPRLMTQVCDDPSARQRLLQLALEEGHDRVLEFHCLGSTEDLREVRELAEWSNARGIDTSVPISMALESLIIDIDDRVPRVDDFFDISTIPNYALMEHNIDTYLRWAKYDYKRPSD